MEVFHTKAAARDWVWQQRSAGRTVGLVPTMGALHEGHYSLVSRSTEQCDATIATIFVNPTQFGPNEDLSKYPRTLESDLTGLESSGASAVFVPPPDSMYQHDHSTWVNPPRVADVLEGELRPGHFKGVTTVVMKLFQILPCNHAYFGQKDYQQAAVILAMVEELDVGMTIHVCPIIRDPDGLALSSRNRYLSSDQRERALAISRSLQIVSSEVAGGERESSVLVNKMRAELAAGGIEQVDYAVVVDRKNLLPLDRIETGSAVALVAARLGTTRLIDNFEI